MAFSYTSLDRIRKSFKNHQYVYEKTLPIEAVLLKIWLIKSSSQSMIFF